MRWSGSLGHLSPMEWTFTVAIISPMPLEPPVTSTTRSLTLKSASISMVLEREIERGKVTRCGEACRLQLKSQCISADKVIIFIPLLWQRTLASVKSVGRRPTNQASLCCYSKLFDARTAYTRNQASADGVSNAWLVHLLISFCCQMQW